MSDWGETFKSVWRCMISDASMYMLIANRDDDTSMLGLLYYFLATFLLTLFVINIITGIMADGALHPACPRRPTSPCPSPARSQLTVSTHCMCMTSSMRRSLFTHP
jgi:hypothetical protein